MKVIITENQHRLLRRVQEIEHLIGPMMDLVYEYMKNGNPSPLNMFHYDMFIDFTTLKITKEIVNRTNFKGDDKIELETQIQRFIETEYIDMIRHYFYSRMIKDRNINESTHELKFKRRYEEIEDGIQDFILTHKLNVMDTFDGFLTEICWDVAQDVVSKMNIPEDDYVMYRNQLIRFIKNNFYEELKEFWDRNHYWGDNKNINESYNKRMLQRRYQHFSESIDSALSRYDVCLYTDVIDFVDRVMDYTADKLYESLFKLGRDDNHSEYYQDIYDFISDHFVDRIYEFYEDNKHFCIDEDGNWIH
jgi:truncated hemoglobin YjbI